MQIGRVIAVAFVVLSAAACGSNNSNSTGTPSSTTTGTTTTTTTTGATAAASIVSGASFLTTTAFSPNPITVKVGDSVTWTNNDSVAHTSTANNSAWNSGLINPGGSFKTTFSTAGSFVYHCSIHPGMVGTVTVQ